MLLVDKPNIIFFYQSFIVTILYLVMFSSLLPLICKNKKRLCDPHQALFREFVINRLALVAVSLYNLPF